MYFNLKADNDSENLYSITKENIAILTFVNIFQNPTYVSYLPYLATFLHSN